MKAFSITEHGIANLREVERPIPEPRHGEVVVRVAAAALNYRDVEIIEGSYHTRFDLPLIPLSDGVGEVVAVGEGVARVRAGDRVAGTFWQNWIAGGFDMADTNRQLGGPIDGMLADYVRLSADGVVQVPAHLSDEEAATLPCAGLTAWHALVTEGGIKPGDTVLVQGTGGVAIFALQFARLAGAKVIVTSSSDAKLERAKALGASGTINYRRSPEWGLEVRALADGRGVDHVVEVGGPGSFGQSLLALRPGGQINVIGYLGGVEGAINPLDIFRRKARVRGIPVGSRQSFEAMNRGIGATGLRPVIDRVFPRGEVRAALDYLRSGQHFGKVVLRS
ncbi:zinc-dependent alcohol dehydrogenase family protein [Phreatobacter stygius]|uniref:NAD(P)-dependent alcohol dehydrogenase n=1 Tax=Phreatobacter stygius TaxID=1940610 RepID=A0A4D7AR00_9HYPH|nr:NAD(P)-dependent alcohol dehydrogenase [Phreatobacter stygius]QCI63744.1 NAD(P)-dependent alcohol dehydrogenase [Phreatobacter stygius]